eukprot:2149816-Pyramimonas_sp.AAC.1
MSHHLDAVQKTLLVYNLGRLPCRIPRAQENSPARAGTRPNCLKGCALTSYMFLCEPQQDQRQQHSKTTYVERLGPKLQLSLRTGRCHP